jgi:hypothetical protein
MPKTVTLSSLRDQSKQRADMVNSSFLTDAEWNQNINNSWYELYDLLIGAYGNDYYASTQTINVVSGAKAYAVGATHYKTLGVDYVVSTTEKYPLNRYTLRDRNRRNDAYVRRSYQPDYEYRLTGGNIEIMPVPNSSFTLEHIFIPVAVALSSDGDTIDGVNGFEEYIVVDAAIKALQKEESDVSVLLQQKAYLKQRLEQMAEDRNAGDPERATDVSNYFGVDGY